MQALGLIRDFDFIALSLGGDLDVDGGDLGIGRGGGGDGGTDVRLPGNVDEVADEGLCGGGGAKHNENNTGNAHGKGQTHCENNIWIAQEGQDRNAERGSQCRERTTEGLHSENNIGRSHQRALSCGTHPDGAGSGEGRGVEPGV